MILLFGYAVTLFFICNVDFNYYKINLLDRSNRNLYAYGGVFSSIVFKLLSILLLKTQE